MHGNKAISTDGDIAEPGLVSAARIAFHLALVERVLRVTGGIPSNADGSNRRSVEVANGIAARIGTISVGSKLAGQVKGNKFEEICETFLLATFPQLTHLRPGSWHVLIDLALIGAFGTGAQLYDREKANIRIAEQHEDFFTRNAIVILAEQRMALAVKRPEAFVDVTFDSAPATS